MGQFNDILEGLERWERDYDLLIMDELDNYEDDIIVMQQKQLYSGIDSDGDKIYPPYTNYTKQIKREKGQPYDRVTLKDEGDFYADMYSKNYGANRFIDSKDEKAEELKLKYGEDIFGLMDNNLDKLSKLMSGNVIQLFRKIVLG